MHKPLDLSVIIPAYNEEQRLEESLQALTAYLQPRQRAYEIIVVDDGSQDQTSTMVRQLAQADAHLRVLVNHRNRGKGASIRRGVAAARGAWILFTDADLSTPITELDKLAQVLERGADIAIASRDMPGAKVTQHQPFYREFMGKAFNALVRLLVMPEFHDTQCGFKLFQRSMARNLFLCLTIPRFGFDIEILYLAKRAGARIVEVPVEWHNVLGSKVSPWKDAMVMLIDLFRVRCRHCAKSRPKF